LLAPMLRGLVAQRLVRRVCADCAGPHVITPSESALLSGAIAAGETVKRGAGCDVCHDQGFIGRLPIYEIIEVDRALENLIHEGASEAVLQDMVRKKSAGILADGVDKLRQGLTTVEEVARAVRDDFVMSDAD